MRSAQFNKPARFEPPQLFAIRGGDLALSGAALLGLMQAVLDRGLPFRFRARGWSMAPFIRDGDVITVSPLLNRMPGVGEVVAFIHPHIGKLVVHRVVARREAGVVILGDNDATCADGNVPQENLLGRVIRIERNRKLVWLGLGPERILIAWLSRSRMLIPARDLLASCLKRLS